MGCISDLTGFHAIYGQYYGISMGFIGDLMGFHGIYGRYYGISWDL